MSFSELEFVEWLSGRATKSPSLRKGIGDDMAILNVDGKELFFSSDLLLEGVHFDSKTQSMDLIGRKAIACSLSDCAAMAVKPMAVTVSVAFPSTCPIDGARSLYEGIFALADHYQLAVAGGDTTKWAESLAIDVAIVAAPWKDVKPILRSGAKIGDKLYVTGPLGGSLLGEHLRFIPRVSEAKLLAEAFGAKLHAMIDITDGLSLDLARLCKASEVGATLEEARLDTVTSDDARRSASEDNKTPLEHVLSDGEDFELLMAIQGDVEFYPGPLFQVGEITETGYSLARTDGRVQALEPRGFVH